MTGIRWIDHPDAQTIVGQVVSQNQDHPKHHPDVTIVIVLDHIIHVGIIVPRLKIPAEGNHCQEIVQPVDRDRHRGGMLIAITEANRHAKRVPLGRLSVPGERTVMRDVVDLVRKKELPSGAHHSGMNRQLLREQMQIANSRRAIDPLPAMQASAEIILKARMQERMKSIRPRVRLRRCKIADMSF